MISERLNNARPAIGLAAGAVAVAVGAWGPWILRAESGGTTVIDAEAGVDPYRVVCTIAAALLAVLAGALWFVTRPTPVWMLRLASVPVVATAALFALGNWMRIVAHNIAAAKADGAPATEAGGWGLVVMALGACLALTGALWPSRRRLVERGPRVTRPGDSEPVRENRLTPGWYTVDGRRAWWDGRAWA